MADADEARHEYGLEILGKLPRGRYDGVILAVRHHEIVALGAERVRQMLTPRGVLYDLKGVLPVSESDGRL